MIESVGEGELHPIGILNIVAQAKRTRNEPSVAAEGRDAKIELRTLSAVSQGHRSYVRIRVANNDGCFHLALVRGESTQLNVERGSYDELAP